MSSRTRPSSVGCTTASWLASTVVALAWVNSTGHASAATTSPTST